MNEISLAFFRRCTKCGVTYPATADFFHRSNRGRYGLQALCRACKRLDKRAYRRDNADAIREYFRRYRVENADTLAAYNRRWRADNAEHAREYRAGWIEGHRERYNAAKCVRESRRRAAKNGADGSHTADEVWAMYEDQDGLCAYCEMPLFGSFHVDHMLPLSRGGSDDWTNLALACPICNVSKHDSTAEEFVNRRRELSISG